MKNGVSFRRNLLVCGDVLPYTLAFLGVCIVVTALLLLSVAKGAGLLVVITKLFPSTRSQILREGTESRRSGFDPHGGIDRHVGLEGVLLTDARPAGKARLGEETVDIVSRDGFLTKGTPVRAVGRQAGSVVVSARSGDDRGPAE